MTRPYNWVVPLPPSIGGGRPAAPPGWAWWGSTGAPVACQEAARPGEAPICPLGIQAQYPNPEGCEGVPNTLL